MDKGYRLYCCGCQTGNNCAFLLVFATAARHFSTWSCLEVYLSRQRLNLQSVTMCLSAPAIPYTGYAGPSVREELHVLLWLIGEPKLWQQQVQSKKTLMGLGGKLKVFHTITVQKLNQKHSRGGNKGRADGHGMVNSGCSPSTLAPSADFNLTFAARWFSCCTASFRIHFRPFVNSGVTALNVISYITGKLCD